MLCFANSFYYDKNNAKLAEKKQDYKIINDNFIGKELWVVNGGTWNLYPLDHVKVVSAKIEATWLQNFKDAPVENNIKDTDLKDYTLIVNLQKDDGTLVTGSLLNDNKQLSDNYSLTNPFTEHPDWPDSAWGAIKSEKVHIGMNKDMCRMSWGTPSAINTTTTIQGSQDQWVYKTGEYKINCLYFTNGILTAIQN